jgi:hypothetical protein
MTPGVLNQSLIDKKNKNTENLQMKKFIKISAYIMGSILIFVVSALVYSGIFTGIKIEEKKLGPYKVVYEDHRGSYSKIAPIMDSVYKKLKSDGIDSTTGIGIYYDNPEEVEDSNLRSRGGCVIQEKDYSSFDMIKSGYKVIDIPAYKCVTLEFPLKTKLSIIIGVIKGYPKIKKHLDGKNLRTIDAPYELYEKNSKMTIAFPTGKI